MLLGYLKNDYVNSKGKVKVPVKITLGKNISSILITGKSGSGKSKSTQWYLWDILHHSESLVLISDYKSSEEYSFALGCNAYADASEALKMIERYYELFTEIRKNKIRLKKHCILVIEEWGGLLSYAEITGSKKLKTELQAKLGEIMMVSRGLNMGIILCTQRPDASIFTSSATREQFQATLAFGRSTNEMLKMVSCSELDENLTLDYKAGQALLLVDGQDGVQEIIVPLITNSDVMLKGIRHYLDLQPDLETLIRSPDLLK